MKKETTFFQFDDDAGVELPITLWARWWNAHVWLVLERVHVAFLLFSSITLGPLVQG